MIKRTAKEYSISDETTGLKTKYGALDKKNPEVIYIKSRATITPKIKKRDFSDSISKLKKVFEDNVRKTMAHLTDYDKRHICTLEISENGISYGKKSRVRYDIFIKPKTVKPLEEYRDEIQKLSHIFNTDLKTLLNDNNIDVR